MMNIKKIIRKNSKTRREILKMNRDLMKGIVIFGIGAGLGATITNVLLRNKYDIILKEEIEAIREAAISREKRMNRNDQDSCVDENGMPHKRYDENGRVLTPNKDRYNRIVRRYNNTETATELAEPDTRRVMTEDELEYRRCEKMSRHEDDTECCGYPYVITVEQFNEENNHFDKITLSYYEDDDTLTDENDEMIQDRESVIGVDALRSFGEGS
jgi:hypothetical protein